MASQSIHVCQCCRCQGEQEHPDQERHHQLNVVMNRLDEQQRRWLAALESMRIGHGGDTLLSQITGLHVDTIRRGREELQSDLQGRPHDRTRLPGGGRPRLEKKAPPSSTT